MDFIFNNVKIKNELIENYIEFIKNSIKDGDVLDVGCCATNKNNLMKRHLEYSKTAKKIFGIDYNKEMLDIAKNKFKIKNLYYCDLTDDSNVDNITSILGKFDHIICTDVIEHISNLTIFFDNIKKFMTSKSVLHLTTPNCRSIRWFYRAYKFNNFAINRDHVCWFDITTLYTLLKRSKLRINKLMYCIDDKEKAECKDIGLKFKNSLAGKIYITISKE